MTRFGQPRWVRAGVVLGALLVLGTVNWAIAGKERLRRDGEAIFLPLAPVDPRSLMQGDYMALRFQLVQEMDSQAGSALGSEGESRWVGVALDSRRVAHLAPAGASADLRLRYRIRSGAMWLGTNAFFFEEGAADRFAPARFGEFRVDRASGDAMLVGLRDAALRPL